MLVSIIVLTYNQENYVRDALASAIDQDYQDCEIIISDDCSTDGTVAEIKEVINKAQSRKKIITNFNVKNLGLTGNLNKAIGLSRGEYLVLCAGDDVSLPFRVSRSIELLSRDPSAMLVSFAVRKINSRGEMLDAAIDEKRGVEKYSLKDHLSGLGHVPNGASRTIRRRVFDSFPAFSESCPTEDTTGLFRSLLLGHAIVSGEIAILYRIHQNNLSSDASIDQMNVDLITHQYRSDLEVAKERGIVSIGQAGSIMRRIDVNHKRRKFKQNANKKNLNLMDYFRFIFGWAFSTSEKIHYLKMISKGRRLY